MEHYSATRRSGLLILQHSVLCEEAKCKTIHTVWFHFYKVLEQAKLTCSDRQQISDSLRLRLGVWSDDCEGNYWVWGNVADFQCGGVYKAVEWKFIFCYVYFNNSEFLLFHCYNSAFHICMTKNAFLYVFIYWSKLYLLVLFKGKYVLIYLMKCVYHAH